MRISEVRAQLCTMKLARPYSIAYGTFEQVQNVFVELVTDDGLVGVGGAAPEPHVTGETVEAVVEALNGRVGRMLEGCDPKDRPAILARVDGLSPRSPALRASLELALVELLLGHHGLNLQTWVGRSRTSVPVGATIGIRSLEDTVSRAKARVSEGVVQLKIKGGHDVDGDLARVEAVRQAIGPDITLWFDANQGYDVPDALRFAREARNLVSLLEQPVAADDLDAMAAVTRESPLPVFADESVQDVSDALRIAAKGAAHGLNIKLMKLGGIAACRDVAAIARAAGLDVMVGCMDESALTVGAAAALACGMPGRVHADLDGDLDLIDDPYSGRVIREGGWLRPHVG